MKKIADRAEEGEVAGEQRDALNCSFASDEETRSGEREFLDATIKMVRLLANLSIDVTIGTALGSRVDTTEGNLFNLFHLHLFHYPFSLLFLIC